MRKTFVTLIGGLLFAGLLPLALRGEEANKALVRDIDRQLACYCGCSLTVADCRVSMTCSESAALNKEVEGLVSTGMDKAQVLAKMREKYGESILAAPTKEGFNLTAWTFPFLAILLGGVFATYMIRKWKADDRGGNASGRKPRSGPASAAKAPTDYDKRVEDELANFDM